jgi:hypothetical protein
MEVILFYVINKHLFRRLTIPDHKGIAKGTLRSVIRKQPDFRRIFRIAKIITSLRCIYPTDL